MKNILLVAQGASSSNEIVARAAVECGRGLRRASSSHEAFEILARGVDDVDVVIIDVDGGIDRLCVLDAISYCDTAPPMIVITESQDTETSSMAYRHGAAACISQPFRPCELAALITDVCLPDWQLSGGSCDRWGHPQGHERLNRIGHSYDHLHCLTM